MHATVRALTLLQDKALVTYVHDLTSNASNTFWKPLKSPDEVSRIDPITDAENEELPIFWCSVMRGDCVLNGRSVKLRRTM